MNTPNNKRKKETRDKISKIFITLLQTKEISEISVTDICKLAKINRSTFYVNYLDIYDLADKIGQELEQEVSFLYQEEKETQNNSNDFLKLFKHIKDNQIFYKTYFKLNMDKNFIINEYDYNLSKELYDDKYIDYHMEFFKAGLNAIIKKWLNNGCKESPEEIESILKSEYSNKNNTKN